MVVDVLLFSTHTPTSSDDLIGYPLLRMAYSQSHRLALRTHPALSSGSRIDPAILRFPIDPSKLNARFEAYKLIQDDASSCVKSYALPSRPPPLCELYQPQGEGGRAKFKVSALGYKETKERSLYQVLVPAVGERRADEPCAAYIDTNRFLVVLTYNVADDRVIGHPVHRLLSDQESLPSLASISATEWLVYSADVLVLLRLQNVNLGNEHRSARWISAEERRWKVERRGTIKASRRSESKIHVLIQSTKTITVDAESANEGMQGLGFQPSSQKSGASKTEQSARSSTVFDVRLVELDLADPASTGSDKDDADVMSDATLLWEVRGEEPLIMASLDEQHTLLGAEARFISLRDTINQSKDTTTSFKDTSTSSDTNPPSPVVASRRPAPHFSWAQTSDTLTLAFALPSWITTSHVRAHFSLSALSLSFTQDALTLLNTPSSSRITEINTDTSQTATGQDDELTRAARMIASGRYTSRSTWGEIDPTGSVWTLERAKRVSLLTLHLEKKHQGTRWMQVFGDRTRHRETHAEAASRTQLSFQQARSTVERAANGQSGIKDDQQRHEAIDQEDNQDDVPETMDPSELLTMLEGMDKYTVDEESTQGFGMDRTGFDASASAFTTNGGTSLSLDQPSLLKDSLEEEDANVGRPLVLTTISTGHDEHVRSSKECWTVLATPLPGSNNDDTVVMKHELDGAIFSLSDGAWMHTCTMPALSFVLASKRDAQRIHVYKRRQGFAVLAFESAPRVTGGSRTDSSGGAGNLFVYYSTAERTAQSAPSRVLRLAGATSGDEATGGNSQRGASGPLLGVCNVRLPMQAHVDHERWEDTLVCLCENRILLLRGVL